MADKNVLSQPTWYSRVRPVIHNEASAPSANSAAPRCKTISHCARRMLWLACHQLRSKFSAILRRLLPRPNCHLRGARSFCHQLLGATGWAANAAAASSSSLPLSVGCNKAVMARLRLNKPRNQLVASKRYMSKFHNTTPISAGESKSTRCGSSTLWPTKPISKAPSKTAASTQRVVHLACSQTCRTSAGNCVAAIRRCALSCKNFSKLVRSCLPCAPPPSACSVSCVMASRFCGEGTASLEAVVSMAWAKKMSRAALAFIGLLSGKPERSTRSPTSALCKRLPH